jgi:hypothetical protein
MSFRIPLNVDEQTRLLVEAGIAAKVLRFLPHMIEETANVTLEQCRFWAERTYEHIDGLPLLAAGLQVVVQYPRYDDDRPYPYSGYGMIVAAGGDPWILTNGEYLSPEQLTLVEQLAGPPENWLPGPLRA